MEAIERLTVSRPTRKISPRMGGGDNSLHLWDIDAGREFHTPIDFHDPKLGDSDNGEIWGVAFSHDGSKVACANYNRTIHVYDLSTMKDLKEFSQTHDGAAYAVSFNNTDDLLASGGGDKWVRIWDLKALQQAQIFKDQWRSDRSNI